MTLRVAGAQMNLTVGDITGNEGRILSVMSEAAAAGADVLLTPELALTGYPPEDLVHRVDFVEANLAALERIAAATGDMTVVVGFVDHAEGGNAGALDARTRDVANAAAVLRGGRILGVYHKVLLPNYGVFDEDRNFAPGDDPDRVWAVGGETVGVSICEDIWVPDGPPAAQALAGARILLNINASPYHRGKAAEREEMLRVRAMAAGRPLVYLNLVGGQDELIFDGASLVLDERGEVVHRSPQFEEDLFIVDLPGARGMVTPLLDPVEEVYRALVVGVRDYVGKNGFKGVV
ncbi:MAG: NAD+ synthase, partial [Actinobacteria bacterium]|nr:NAD+ synthase [Actinomycetota bacterium]